MPNVKGDGKIVKKRSGYGKNGRGGYEYVQIYVPSKISKDSSFPFIDKEEVSIEIQNNKLIISKKDRLIDLIKQYKLDKNFYTTLPKLIEAKAIENQKRPFLIFKDNIYSYKETNEKVNSIAHGILKLIKQINVKKNTHIAIMLPNCPEFIFCWFAIVKAKCIFIPVNRFLEGDSLEYILNHSDSEILIVDFQFLKTFKMIEKKLIKLKKIVVFNAPDTYRFNNNKYMNFSDINTNNIKNPDLNIRSTNIMGIIYTEGTTGPPKGVVYKHLLVLSGQIFGKLLKQGIFRKDDDRVVYCPTPLFQAFSQIVIVISSIFLNATIVLAERFDAAIFWDDVRRYNAELIYYYGGIIQSLMDEPPKDIDRYHKARFALGGQAPKEIWNSFENRFNLTIFEGWAATEAIGFTCNFLGSKGGKIGSIGKPYYAWKLKIVNNEGKELPPGANNIGEIVAKKSFPLTLEYYKTPESTPMIFKKDGYISTGDLGYKDNDGFIYFVGRKNEIIKKAGKEILPFFIESIANAHPSILESAAFGVPSENYQEEDIKICIVLKRQKQLSYEEIYDYLNEHLAYYMVPRYIEIKKRLRSSSERIKKYLLRNEWNKDEIKKNTWDSKISNLLILSV